MKTFLAFPQCYWHNKLNLPVSDVFQFIQPYWSILGLSRPEDARLKWWMRDLRSIINLKARWCAMRRRRRARVKLRRRKKKQDVPSLLCENKWDLSLKEQPNFGFIICTRSWIFYLKKRHLSVDISKCWRVSNVSLSLLLFLCYHLSAAFICIFCRLFNLFCVVSRDSLSKFKWFGSSQMLQRVGEWFLTTARPWNFTWFSSTVTPLSLQGHTVPQPH